MDSKLCPQNTYIVRTLNYDRSQCLVQDSCADTYVNALEEVKARESDYLSSYTYERYVIVLAPVEIDGMYRGGRRILYSGAENFK